jgi:tetratricopeptide (TPR) repeat protein
VPGYQEVEMLWMPSSSLLSLSNTAPGAAQPVAGLRSRLQRRLVAVLLPALGWLLGLVLGAAASLLLSQPVGAAEPATTAGSSGREQALGDLRAASSITRLAAVKRLSDVGVAADADALMARLSDDDMQVRAAAAQAVWKVWGRTGDAAVDAQYKRGLEQMTAGDLDESIATFSLLVRNRPDFAEAWNKRATAYFLRGDFERSLRDCDQVFKLNPKHFGALAGASTIHARMGRPDKALELFKRALEVNPNMDDAAEMIQMLQRQIEARRRDMI